MFRTLCPSVLSASMSDLYISMSDCPRRRIVSAGTNFEPLNPKLIVYCPKRRRTNQSRPPLPDQTRLASSSLAKVEKNRCGDEEAVSGGCAIEADP